MNSVWVLLMLFKILFKIASALEGPLCTASGLNIHKPIRQGSYQMFLANFDNILVKQPLNRFLDCIYSLNICMST